MKYMKLSRMINRTTNGRNFRIESLNRIEEAIQNQCQKGTILENDVVLWKYKGDTIKSKFNSKETWKQTITMQSTKEWYKGIWFSYATPKYSFISWLAIHSRLSTGDQTLRWNTWALVVCSFCLEPMESRNHLFFTCLFSGEIWKKPHSQPSDL